MSEPQATQFISSHVTSEGLLVYSRGEDGKVEMWLRRWGQTPELVNERTARPGPSGVPAVKEAC